MNDKTIEFRWYKPSIEATKHDYIVALYKILDDENDEYIEKGFFNYDSWNGIFIGNCMQLKLKDILAWFPLPPYNEFK